jgi:hypothetical protein
LRTQFSSALEPRNLFLLVADIYRRISLLQTKIQTYITNDNSSLRIDEKTLTGQDSTTANTGFASEGVTCPKGRALCFYSSSVQVDSFVLRNPPFAKPRNVSGKHIKPSNHVETHIPISFFTSNTFLDNRSECRHQGFQ